jgi:tRNA-dihydrouridine synthase
MVGRASYENTWLVSDFDRRYFGKKNPGYSRREILKVT